MKNKIYEKLANYYGIFVIGVVFFLTIGRLFYGVELSDEAYTVAETYMVSEGALPFVNNWSQMPGYTLLLAPFVRVYTMIFGGTDGIFLYFRFLSFLININVAIFVSIVLRKYIKNIIVLTLCSLIYVGASGWDYVSAFRGDNLSIDLLAVGVLVLAIAFAEEKSNYVWYFLSGLLIALAVLCYPTLVFEYAYFLVAIISLCIGKKKSLKILASFLIGSAISTVVIAGYLSLNSGFLSIFSGIKYLLQDVTYFQIENTGFSKVPSYFIMMLEEIIMLAIASIGCYVLFTVCSFVFLRKKIFVIDLDYCSIKRIYIRRIAMISLIAGICIDHLYQLWRFKTTDSINISLYAITIETIAVPVVWRFIKEKKKISNYLMGFIWAPTYIWVVATGIVTYSSMFHRHVLMKNAAFLLCIFTTWAVKDCFKKENDDHSTNNSIANAMYSFFVCSLPIILLMGNSFTYLFNAYAYVYRDESIRRLNTVVAEGPYRGMYTTEKRANGLIELDSIIDKYVDTNDYVLAMDNDPFIYLMSEGRICTPSTWDMALYSYNFDQPDIYYDYFKVVGTEPTKIIYFNYGRDKIMSIDT